MSDLALRFTAYSSTATPIPAKMGIASIEAWPAVGGGLLVGLAEPMLAGGAPLRTPIKTAFLRLDGGGALCCMLPYVALEAETCACIRALVAEELAVPESSITVTDAVSDFRILDLHPAVEQSLQALAATMRTLLIAAAAENWNRADRACEARNGAVWSAGRSVGYRDIAADAALTAVPRALRLRCGRSISIA